MVEFRPKSDWKGEFGFDWLRIGDVKMEVVGKERYKTIIEGGYNIVDANGDGSTADEAFYQLKTKEYNSIPTKVKNKAYRVPWLNLYPPSAKGTPPPPVSAELQILVTVEGEKPPQNIEFDFNKSLFSLTKLSISDKAIGPKRIASDGTVKITCLEEYDTNQEIRVLVDPAASLMLNQPISLAGKIIICANSKRMRLKLILIRVKTDISGTPLTGNYTPVEKINLSNTLYQAFIYGYLESGPILDLSGDVNFRRATNGKFLDPVKDEINQNHVDIFNYVRQEFFKIDANKKYEKNYFLSFSFNEPATGGIIGQAEDIGVRCVFLFADRDPYTLNHEVLHGLFLNHTHEDTGYPVTENYKYIFTYGKTDNVMSYNSVSKTLMRWQWKILRKKFK
jgi:hypothetical protein